MKTADCIIDNYYPMSLLKDLSLDNTYENRIIVEYLIDTKLKPKPANYVRLHYKYGFSYKKIAEEYTSGNSLVDVRESIKCSLEKLKTYKLFSSCTAEEGKWVYG